MARFATDEPRSHDNPPAASQPEGRSNLPGGQHDQRRSLSYPFLAARRVGVSGALGGNPALPPSVARIPSSAPFFTAFVVGA